jgi:hypothetical protein
VSYSKNKSHDYSSTLTIEALGSSEMSVNLYKCTHHIPDDSYFRVTATRASDVINDVL